jgi:hypothetical protein
MIGFVEGDVHRLRTDVQRLKDILDGLQRRVSALEALPSKPLPCPQENQPHQQA